MELELHDFDSDAVSTGFAQTREVLTAGVREGVAPGFVAGFYSAENPEVGFAFKCGNRRSVGSILPMEFETLFDLASITKVLATWPLIARFIDRGWIKFDTPISQVLPRVRLPGVTVAHLLSHTAGLTWWEPFFEEIRAGFSAPLWNARVNERQNAMRELVLSAAPEFAPGVKAVYSDLSFLLLGFLAEELGGEAFDLLVRRHVWEPLGLPSTEFFRTDQSLEGGMVFRAAATENCPWRGGVLQGQVHDDNCYAMGGYAGHAGAFGTLRDLLSYGSALLSTNFISEKVRKVSFTQVSVSDGNGLVPCERTRGWDTPATSGGALGGVTSRRTVGHLGFTGTSFWIDLERGWVFVLLSNRVHPSRENIAIREFRPRFHRALAADLTARHIGMENL